MNELDMKISHYELTETVVQLQRVLRTLRDLDVDSEQASSIHSVWNTVRLVSASAMVEHLRLLGMDVSVGEQQLHDKGSAPWRDLVDRVSGDLADAQHLDEASDVAADLAVEPQIPRWSLRAGPWRFSVTRSVREGV